MKLFNSKILLFGEYSILKGSSALTIPFKRYTARLSFPAQQADEKSAKSNEVLKDFLNYLSGLQSSGLHNFDFSSFREDIEKGLYLESTIPQNYGLGSSGALVASIFESYYSDIKSTSLSELKALFALAESFFHSKSSGIDPLTVFTETPLIFQNKNVFQLPMHALDPVLKNFYLVDSGIQAGTDSYVEYFSKTFSVSGTQKIFNEYLQEVNQLINEVRENLSVINASRIKNISGFQMEYFTPMIPESILDLWKEGLQTDLYYFKLCGSGGGGYFLIYSTLGEKKLQETIKKPLIPLTEAGIS